MRKTVAGTPQRPRLAVYRSLTHIYAQVIDDERGPHACCGVDLEKALKRRQGQQDASARRPSAAAIAKKAMDAGVTQVVFDRGGNRYHGRVKALAEAAREGGLKF